MMRRVENDFGAKAMLGIEACRACRWSGLLAMSAETVTDVHVTRNLAGKVVMVRYVTVHEFSGQTVVDYSVPVSTIDRGEIVYDPREPGPVKA